MRRPLLIIALLVTTLSCEVVTGPLPPPDPPPPPNSAVLNGTWRAIYWIVQPHEAPVLDVVDLGGTLDLTITNGYVSGEMTLPEGVTSGNPLTASMSGVVLVDGDRAQFLQHEDTFVRRASWQIGQDALFIVDHLVETTRFTVVLIRGW